MDAEMEALYGALAHPENEKGASVFSSANEKSADF